LLRGARDRYGKAIRAAQTGAGFDVPANGAFVLGAMARNEASLDEVLVSLGVPERRANRLVEKLVERGYLEPVNSPDASRPYGLSERGRAAAQAARDAVERLDAELIAELGTAQVDATRATLATLSTGHPVRPEEHGGVSATVARPGGLSYLHLPAPDPGAAADFYAAVFGWTVQGRDTDRPSFDDGTGHVAGAWMSGLAVSAAGGPLPYIYVEGVDDVAERIGAAGGEVVQAPYPEGNLRVATFRDPAGNVLGIWEMQGPPA
jgi:predicted enzyme related to lactoylglutathione lyase/DNA-binding MarR family transcriptional regulator